MSFLRCKKEHKIQGKGRERLRKATAKLMVLVMLFTLCMVWAPGELNSSAAATTTITYNSYVQSYGWTGWKNNGALSGKTGVSKRLEGINIKLKNKTTTGSIKYRTYVQTYGWKPWVTEGKLSGTKGESKRVEAIQIQLTGKMANAYDVYYRVHAQSYGWLAWAKNGASAGTQGLGRRIEAIQIVLVKKGGAKPGNIGGVKSARKDCCVTKAMMALEWKEAYANLIANLFKENSIVDSWDGKAKFPGSILLSDMDSDGIPELFVTVPGVESYIYTYSGKSVKLLKSYGSGRFFCAGAGKKYGISAITEDNVVYAFVLGKNGNQIVEKYYAWYNMNSSAYIKGISGFSDCGISKNGVISCYGDWSAVFDYLENEGFWFFKGDITIADNQGYRDIRYGTLDELTDYIENYNFNNETFASY